MDLPSIKIEIVCEDLECTCWSNTRQGSSHQAEPLCALVPGVLVAFSSRSFPTMTCL